MRQQGGPPMDDLSLHEEQQKSQSFAEEFEEEGHEVDENTLVPIFRDQSSATTPGNDSDIVAGSAADDGDGPSAAVIGGGSPCQTRRNKLVTVLAGAALVVVVALTAGLVPYFNNKSKGDDGSAQLIAAMAARDGSEEVEVGTYYYPTYSPTTYSPTAAPVLPMAGAVSNDFGAGDGSDGSNDSVNGRIRRRRQ